MPRNKKDTGETPANKQKGKKVCTCCHQEKNLVDFYLSYSPMYSLDKRVPICKDCCKTSVLNDDGTIDYIQLKKLLRNIDKPLYYDLFWSAEESIKKENGYLRDEEIEHHGKDILQKYFTLIVMRQDKSRSYSDSENDSFIHQNNNRTIDEKKKIIAKYRPLFEADYTKDIYETIKVEKEDKYYNYDDFEVNDDMIQLFGEGYTKNEYRKMFKKYEKLKLNYSLQTNLHQEALATYVRFKVKEEDATAKGEVDEAKKWYDAAQNAAANGKLTPKQLTEADLQGGINSFSEIFKAVEQAIDVIPILPHFKYRPNDALDFVIWCYINYARDLQGLPQCPYEDVYKFYDKKKEEYLEQYGDPYGIFKDDPTTDNRENIKKFITLPKDYTDGDE